MPDITVDDLRVAPVLGTRTPSTVRAYPRSSFLINDAQNTAVTESSPYNGGAYFKSMALTLNATYYYVPGDFTLPSTTDSPDNPNGARWGLFVFDTNDILMYAIGGLESFMLDHTDVSQTPEDIIAFNTGALPILTTGDRTVTGDLEVGDDLHVGGGLQVDGPITSDDTLQVNDDVNVSGNVTATAFIGSGAGLTGVAAGTGGVINTGSTTIGSDSDADGVGVTDFQTRAITRQRIRNAGETELFNSLMLPAPAHASLPAAGTARRLSLISDRSKGIWGDNGTAWYALDGEVFNVKAFGAIGDGTADDTAAIANAITALTAAGRGVLFFPPAVEYKTTGGFTISVPTKIVGCGRTDAHFESGSTPAYVSKITCTSATAILFNVTANHARFEGLYLRNTAGSTPTAGSGVKVSNGTDYLQKVDFYDCTIWGFYDGIDYQVGDNWRIHNCYFVSPVRYGVHIQNLVVPDAGGWSISDSEFLADNTPAPTAIRIESCGGAKITNTNILGYATAVHATGTSTSILLISNCCFEHELEDFIIIEGWSLVGINNVEFGVYTTTTKHAIHFTEVARSIISNCLFVAPLSSGIYGIKLTDCVGVEHRNISSFGFQGVVQYDGTYKNEDVLSISRGAVFLPVTAFSNSWANAGGGKAPAGVNKIDGKVELRGTVTGGTINTTIFSVPAAWLPAGDLIFPAYNNGVFCAILINSVTGAVGQINGASNVNVSLDGIYWIP